MSRLTGLVIAACLCTAMFVTALTAQPTGASHDPDRKSEGPQEPLAEHLQDAQIDGIVYRIRRIDGKRVLVVLDTEMQASVSVFLINPDLVSLVKSRTVCTGRYVVATGVRTTVYTLDAQGLTVDTSRACGSPPE